MPQSRSISSCHRSCPACPIGNQSRWASFCVSGGYQWKSYRLDTKDIDTENGVLVFVKVDNRQKWLLKAAVGKSARHGACMRTTLFDELKKKLVTAVAAGNSDSQGRQGDAQDGPLAADPMEALAAIEPSPKKRKTYKSKRGKDNIMEVTMPAFDPIGAPTQRQATCGTYPGHEH